MSSGKEMFTQMEADECFRLIRKARKRGAFEAIMRRVRDVEDIELDEAWLASPSGSMTDGSKRLREKKVPIQAGMISPYAGAYSAGTAIPAVPCQLELRSLGHVWWWKVCLQACQAWNKTLVAFGKYKGIKSYIEMYEASDPETSGYRASYHSHYSSGSAGLRDLVDYFKARGDSSTCTQAVIPGSAVPRTYKNKLKGSVN